MTDQAIEISSTEQEAIHKFNEALGPLLEAGNQPITDQASLVASGNAKISLDSYVKAVKAHFASELNPLEERVKRIKNNIASLTAPALTATKTLVDRQREWSAEEKRKAEAETKRKQDELDRAKLQKADEEKRAAEKEATERRQAAVKQINADLAAGAIGKREAAKRLKEAGAEEEAAKQTAAAVAEEQKAAPSPTVRVAPNIPVVAGVKNQTFYYASVHQASELIGAFAEACENENHERRDFLARFIAVNESEVSKYARDTKNPNAVMAVLPGVKAWSKG